ncbi:hypothetical protein HPB50_022957 [Hyalomma asiaticum]|uniref:Uncharacterized protein n=1 Tax=Hyalomma asiaticum TaxID=266040 RepID=A0ACB7S8Z8_HYAAI|nr:hypothetical protein HPB50_022957 [Hyalomma asiaticum]
MVLHEEGGGGGFVEARDDARRSACVWERLRLAALVRKTEEPAPCEPAALRGRASRGKSSRTVVRMRFEFARSRMLSRVASPRVAAVLLLVARRAETGGQRQDYTRGLYGINRCVTPGRPPRPPGQRLSMVAEDRVWVITADRRRRFFIVDALGRRWVV